MAHELTRTATPWELQAWHYEAVELRYLGLQYKEISQVLLEKYSKAFPDYRLRRWFANGGILHDLYAKYTIEHNKERQERMNKRLNSLAEDIPEILEETLNLVQVNPFTGQVVTGLDGKPIKVRNSVTNEALKILINLVKESGDPVDNAGNFSRVRQYIESLKHVPLPATDATPS